MAGPLVSEDVVVVALVAAGDLQALEEDLGARRRIAGDAAAEVDQPSGLVMLLALAEEIDLGDDQAALAVVQLHAADVGE